MLAHVNAELAREGLPPFDPAARSGLHVAFRKLPAGDRGVNWIACRRTARLGDAPPFGNNCHCEVIVYLSSGVSARIGIVCRYLDDGKWRDGTLFVRPRGRMHGYEFVPLPCSRNMELRLLCFALRERGAAFSRLGYYTRALAWRGFGIARSYAPNAKGARYTCPQLATLLLQAAAREWAGTARDADLCQQSWMVFVPLLDASAQTPNSLYRLLAPLT